MSSAALVQTKGVAAVVPAIDERTDLGVGLFDRAEGAAVDGDRREFTAGRELPVGAVWMRPDRYTDLGGPRGVPLIHGTQTTCNLDNS
jgi:hypothetical protein